MKLLKEVYSSLPPLVQTIGINIYELTEWRKRRDRKFVQFLKLLYDIESWKIERLEEYQEKHLRRIIDYAYNYVPYYRGFLKQENIDVSSIRTLNDLEKLPVIEKGDIILNKHLFYSTKREKFVTLHTSGTTGTPLEVRVSADNYLLFKAAAYKRDLLAGYRQGDWIARFVGDKPVKDCNDKKLYRVSYVMRRIIFPSYCLSVKTFPKIFEVLNKMNVKFIQAYPSTAYLLAKYLEFQDQYFSIKAVLYSSEPMYDFQRKIIEERFQTKAFGFYGQAENLISAIECDHDNYHLTMIDGIMEVEKKGSRGEKGLTVVTSLHNKAMPLIRYALNDCTGYKMDGCQCGSGLPTMYPVETKLEDFVITPDGRAISPSILTFPLKNARNIIESQIVQENMDKITFNVIPSEKYTEKDEQYLLKSLKEMLGGMSIEVKVVRKIPQTSAFKKRFVVNKLGKGYIEKIYEEL